MRHSSLLDSIKSTVLRLLGRSTRLRWDLAGVTERQALQAVCGTQREEYVDQLGLDDAQRLIPLLKGSSVVLDVGCGVGRVEKFIWQHCSRIYAVDVSNRMLSAAKRRLADASNVFLLRTNATDLHMFKDGFFDLCFSFHCLQHMKKEEAWLALNEVFRVLKTDGIAYLHFPNFASETYFSLFKDKRHWKDRSRVRAYSLPELEKILTKTGFGIENEEFACLNPYVVPAESGRDILLTLRK